MIRVLHITNMFPSADKPAFGIFIKEQIDSLDPLLVESSLLVLGERRGLFGYLGSLGELRRAAANVDLVHCHHMLCGCLALLAGIRSKLIVSFTSDGALNYKGRPLWLGSVMFYLVSRFSDFNIYKSRIPVRFRHKSALLPNGVDLGRFTIGSKAAARDELGLDQDRHYVLFVSSSRLTRPEKRFDFFQKVMAQLELRRPGKFAALTMCNVPRAQVPLYFQAAAVHLLTSDVEGSPNSVKESLACGTPVVSRDVGNVATLIAGVEGCELFRGDDAFSVALQVEKALHADPTGVRQSFLGKGLGSKEIAESLQNIYRNICDH